MSSVWFVTPAWQRVELTRICLEQRRQVIDQLAKWGHEAYCVVVADDENAGTARELGFSVVETPNDWLGRKFNDGMQYAVDHGAIWVVPIGSDSWIDPWYFRELPPDRSDVVRTSEMYAPVTEHTVAICRVAGTNPAGPHMFHRDLLAKAGSRPMPDRIHKHTDSNTIRALSPFRWELQTVHPLQYIGFRAVPFITRYEDLWQRWGVVEYEDPWARLAKHYPADLVERAQAAMRQPVAA